jgi:type IV pilus assembly protein PilB
MISIRVFFLAEMEELMRLGTLLMESGLVTPNQMQEALKEHKKKKLKLGQILIRKGVIAESQVVEFLSQQLKIKKFQPDKFAIDLDLAHVIPAKIATKYQVVPLNLSDHLIEVAMIDPLDIDAIDTIEHHTRKEVEPIICTEHDFNHLFKSIYGSFGGINGVLKDIDHMEIDHDTDKINITEDAEVSSLQGMAEEAPVVLLVNSILSQAIQDGASDVHINPQKDHVRIRFRVDGKLYDVPAPPKPMFLPVVSRMKILANVDIAVSRIPQDGRFTVKMKNKDINIRVSTIPSIYGENLVLRLHDTSSGVRALEILGMEDSDRSKIKNAILKPYGMVLSTGPTGSGKSTSLYAILNKINKPDINIITVEDPVEYRMDQILQIQLNRKAGMTFAKSLRSVLRQDPDVIMVGEIRDSETAKVAIQAALTGHRVLSTLHTNDAAGAISRLIDMGIEPFLVSSVVLVSFAQRLIRKACPECKQPYMPTGEVVKCWDLSLGDNGNLVQAKGCVHCMNTGYSGRTGIYEVLVIDEMIQNMILQKKSAAKITKTAIQSGNFKTLKENAAAKVLQGITTLEEAASAVIL